MTLLHKAAFLDRDGVINIDHGYTSVPEQFDFIDGIFDACRHLQQQGYLLIVVTNQSGIARGYYSEHQFALLTSWMKQQFAHGVKIDGVYYCPHHVEKGQSPYNIDCDCRKPRPGMMLQAMREFHIDASQSLMVGDKAADMQAAAAAGIARKILVRSGQPLTDEDLASADEVWDSLAQAQQVL